MSDEDDKRHRWEARRKVITDAVEAHLRRLEADSVQIKCPMCTNPNWQLWFTETGTPFNEQLNGVGADPWSGEMNELLTSPVLPKVALACTRCFFVAEFAWMKILAATKP